ncbi:hypothetical protein JTB14_034489 [Gonioctena quinquepunctata]|nr:hypothetical protein JTB14_034489 [Gonioctena quinquepunctata]
MSDRTLRVQVGDEQSDNYDIVIGTPLGIVLGPLVFLHPNYISQGRTFIYADDTTIIVAADTAAELQDKTELAANSFKYWCDSNNLIVHLKKTVLIEFTSPLKLTNIFTINICHTKISSSQITRYQAKRLMINSPSTITLTPSVKS